MQQFLVAATLVKQPSSASQTLGRGAKRISPFCKYNLQASVERARLQEAEYSNTLECARVCLCFIYCQIKNLTFVSNI